MRQVLHSGLGAICAAGTFLVGIGLVRAADAPAADAGAASAAPADGGGPSASPAPETSKDAGASEPAAAKEPATDAGKAEPAAAKEPAKPESVPTPPAPAPAVEARPTKPAPEAPKPPKKDLGLMIGGSAAALVGAAAMGVGIYYLHVDGQPVCKPGEIAPCDFERDTRTFGDVMLASGSGVFLLGAAAFFWGFYSDDTGVAVAPTGMVVKGRF